MVQGITKTIGPDGRTLAVFGGATPQPPQPPGTRESRQENTRTNADPRERDKEFSLDEAGRLHGLFRRWYESGLLKEECTYEHGVLQGQLTCWYENGKMSREAYYEKGLLKGKSRTWFPSGLPASEEDWDGGMYPRQRVEYYERYSGDGAFSGGGIKSLVWTIGEHVRRTIEWAQDGQVITDNVKDLSRADADEEEKWGPLLRLQSPDRLAALADIVGKNFPEDKIIVI